MQRSGSTQGTPVAQVPQGREHQSTFMPVREVARVLGVSEMTIRRAYAAGVIPGITFGTSCRVLRAFVASLIAAAEAGQQIKVEEFGRQWATRNTKSAEAVA
jgi:excisionase family DNA binding protein